MSQTKTKTPRPLGTVKNSQPHLKKQGSQSSVSSLHGILGNAMTVPPPKEKEERKTKTPVGGNSTPASTTQQSESSNKSTENADKKEKDLKESMVREKRLQLKVASLEKIIEELKKTIQQKSDKISTLQSSLEEQSSKVEDFRTLFEKEKAEHEESKKRIHSVEEELEKKVSQIARLKQDHDKKIEDLETLMGTKISKIKEERDAEIAKRDEKLAGLKRQMVDALQGNSWERQQQLEELTKELSRMQDEANSLRMKLKSSKGKSDNCLGCQDLSAKLEKYSRISKEKDAAIKELKLMCKKMEKQLGLSDDLQK